jgi:sulfatase modifying factor 1
MPGGVAAVSTVQFDNDVVDAKAGGHAGMILICGGTFQMGSDKHYPEEAPVHRVKVDSFFIDSTPVTNRQFKEFVKVTGHVTFSQIPPIQRTIPARCRTCSMRGRWCFRRPRVRSICATGESGGLF